jgi:hypothetical protein
VFKMPEDLLEGAWRVASHVLRDNGRSRAVVVGAVLVVVVVSLSIISSSTFATNMVFLQRVRIGIDVFSSGSRC